MQVLPPYNSWKDLSEKYKNMGVLDSELARLRLWDHLEC